MSVEVSYIHAEKGRVDEEFENVEEVSCLESTNHEYKTLIVKHHDKQRNTTRKPVKEMIKCNGI